MAGFSLVSEPVTVRWYPVDYNNATGQTVYVGQLVVLNTLTSCSGVKAWVPAGNYDKTVDQCPFGIVIGTNNRTPTFNTTYKAEYITSVRTQAAQVARDFAGAEGMWSKGDPQAMVQVAVLDSTSILKGRIFNAAYGTAISVGTVTAVAGSGDGTGFTCGTSGFEFTAVAYNATYYCRSGNNMGLYRVGYDTNAGTGAKTFYGPNWPFTVAVGNTFVGCNLVLGRCLGMTDALGTYLENSAALTTDYISLDVLDINLATAGSEYAIFRINPYQFIPVRA